MSDATLTTYSQEDRVSTVETDQPDLLRAATPPTARQSKHRGPTTGTLIENARSDTVVDQVPSHRNLRLLRRRTQEPVTFSRLEEREGVVLEILEDGVVRARLVDPTGAEPDEEVEIEREQFSPADLHLVEPGALFFWSIGYLTRASGRRQLVLRIDLRRLLTRHTDADTASAETVRSWMEALNWT